MFARCDAIEVLSPLCAVALASALCIGVGTLKNPRHKLMAFISNRSTPDYWFEKAEQCFRRSRTNSNLRVKLEALGNAFMIKAVELDVKLQTLANANYTASLPIRA
jgi:hypothetical protein